VAMRPLAHKEVILAANLCASHLDEGGPFFAHACGPFMVSASD